MSISDVFRRGAFPRDAWRLYPGDHRAFARPRILWIRSAPAALGGAALLYMRNFFRFLLTFWLPLFPLDYYVAVHQPNQPPSWAWGGWFFLGFIGFSALTLTVSDVCNGIHPSIARSYRRLATRRLLSVFRNAFLLAVIVAGPPAVGYFVATKTMNLQQRDALVAALCISSLFVAVFMMYAPIITALEKEISPSAVVQRSWTLGIGYFGRALLALVLAVFIGGLLLGIASPVVHVWPPNENNFRARLVVSRLVMPWLFAAAVLMYYDLRSRKEGYNFRALTEDLWIN